MGVASEQRLNYNNYTSGTSIKGRTKVSQMANKKMKTLFNLAALSVIQYDPELKLYFDNRVANGAIGMSTINIIRNKIIYRVFAVVKRGTPYVVMAKYASGIFIGILLFLS